MAAVEPARRAGIYARISKDENQDELGVARQVKHCREVVARLGWGLVDTYVDNSISAYRRRRRPQYERLRADIRAGVVNAIVVYNPDRLSRDDLRGLEDLIDLLNEHKVAVQSVRAGEFDLTTANGRANARQAGVWARRESEIMSERITDKHQELAEAGKPNGGPRLYGYLREGAKESEQGDTRKLVPHPDEAPIVAEVMRRVAAGETITRIAEDLDARGIRTSTDAHWHAPNVRRMALNGRYAGRRIHKGVDVGKGTWPALVDVRTWRRAVAVLTHPDRPKRRSARRYWLSGGLLECGRCGATLLSKPNRTRTGTVASYTCPVRKLGGCGGVTVNAEAVEQLVGAWVVARVESPEFARSLRRRSKGDKAAEADAAHIEAEMEKLTVAFEDGALSVAEWTRAKKALAERLGRAQERMAVDVADAAAGRYAGQAGKLAAEWAKPDFPLDKRQAIARAVIDRVVVAHVGRGAKVAVPDRVDIQRRA